MYPDVSSRRRSVEGTVPECSTLGLPSLTHAKHCRPTTGFRFHFPESCFDFKTSCGSTRRFQALTVTCRAGRKRLPTRRESPPRRQTPSGRPGLDRWRSTSGCPARSPCGCPAFPNTVRIGLPHPVPGVLQPLGEVLFALMREPSDFVIAPNPDRAAPGFPGVRLAPKLSSSTR